MSRVRATSALTMTSSEHMSSRSQHVVTRPRSLVCADVPGEWQINELSAPNQPPARTIPKMAHTRNVSFRDTWYKRHTRLITVQPVRVFCASTVRVPTSPGPGGVARNRHLLALE